MVEHCLVQNKVVILLMVNKERFWSDVLKTSKGIYLYSLISYTQCH